MTANIVVAAFCTFASGASLMSGLWTESQAFKAANFMNGGVTFAPGVVNIALAVA